MTRRLFIVSQRAVNHLDGITDLVHRCHEETPEHNIGNVCNVVSYVLAEASMHIC